MIPAKGSFRVLIVARPTTTTPNPLSSDVSDRMRLAATPHALLSTAGSNPRLRWSRKEIAKARRHEETKSEGKAQHQLGRDAATTKGTAPGPQGEENAGEAEITRLQRRVGRRMPFWRCRQQQALVLLLQTTVSASRSRL